MDIKAMYKLSYGLFVLTTKDGDKDNGFLTNTAIQVTSQPNQLSVCINKRNFTHDMVMKTGVFTVSTLSRDANLDIFTRFGYQSGKDVDKFADFTDCKRGSNGIYYITKGTNSYISVKVLKTVDLGTHTMFVGEVTDMEVLSDQESITYDYYQNHIKPKPEAVGKSQDGKTVWRCSVCGHEYVGDEMPDDYICPVCQHTADYFEQVTPLVNEMTSIAKRTGAAVAVVFHDVKDSISKNIYKSEVKIMSKWICPVCGYVHEGMEAPEECPVCHTKGATWTKMDGNMNLAATHELGIYDKTVRNNSNVSEEDKKYILEQLLGNYNSECYEVGMYLCMSRIAHREGYPEVGLYLEKIALEKANHAARFAELLGKDLEPKLMVTTKDNLQWRVDCEYGTTESKFNLAHCCKKYDLDALHDSIHEMARDDARFGKALEGMLKRYF